MGNKALVRVRQGLTVCSQLAKGRESCIEFKLTVRPDLERWSRVFGRSSREAKSQRRCAPPRHGPTLARRLGASADSVPMMPPCDAGRAHAGLTNNRRRWSNRVGSSANAPRSKPTAWVELDPSEDQQRRPRKPPVSFVIKHLGGGVMRKAGLALDRARRASRLVGRAVVLAAVLAALVVVPVVARAALALTLLSPLLVVRPLRPRRLLQRPARPILC